MPSTSTARMSGNPQPGGGYGGSSGRTGNVSVASLLREIGEPLDNSGMSYGGSHPEAIASRNRLSRQLFHSQYPTEVAVPPSVIAQQEWDALAEVKRRQGPYYDDDDIHDEIDYIDAIQKRQLERNDPGNYDTGHLVQEREQHQPTSLRMLRELERQAQLRKQAPTSSSSRGPSPIQPSALSFLAGKYNANKASSIGQPWKATHPPATAPTKVKATTQPQAATATASGNTAIPKPKSPLSVILPLPKLQDSSNAAESLPPATTMSQRSSSGGTFSNALAPAKKNDPSTTFLDKMIDLQQQQATMEDALLLKNMNGTRISANSASTTTTTRNDFLLPDLDFGAMQMHRANKDTDNKSGPTTTNLLYESLDPLNPTNTLPLSPNSKRQLEPIHAKRLASSATTTTTTIVNAPAPTVIIVPPPPSTSTSTSSNVPTLPTRPTLPTLALEGTIGNLGTEEQTSHAAPPPSLMDANIAQQQQPLEGGAARPAALTRAPVVVGPTSPLPSTTTTAAAAIDDVTIDTLMMMPSEAITFQPPPQKQGSEVTDAAVLSPKRIALPKETTTTKMLPRNLPTSSKPTRPRASSLPQERRRSTDDNDDALAEEAAGAMINAKKHETQGAQHNKGHQRHQHQPQDYREEEDDPARAIREDMEEEDNRQLQLVLPQYPVALPALPPTRRERREFDDDREDLDHHCRLKMLERAAARCPVMCPRRENANAPTVVAIETIEVLPPIVMGMSSMSGMSGMSRMGSSLHSTTLHGHGGMAGTTTTTTSNIMNPIEAIISSFATGMSMPLLPSFVPAPPPPPPPPPASSMVMFIDGTNGIGMPSLFASTNFFGGNGGNGSSGGGDGSYEYSCGPRKKTPMGARQGQQQPRHSGVIIEEVDSDEEEGHKNRGRRH